MSPFDEDTLLVGTAEKLGLKLERRDSIEIYDTAAVAEAGLTRKTPDYYRIRKLLDEGATVPGVRRRGYEYIMRRVPAAEENNEK
jgi:hypothetical protein